MNREEWRVASGSYERFASAACQVCGASLSEPPRPGYPRRFCVGCRPRSQPKVPQQKACIACGRTFTGNANRLYCHERCRYRSPRYRKPRAPGTPNPRSESKTRRLRQAVAQRDRWICCLCGKPIDPALRWPHPQSCSLQHHQDLHLGGQPYDPANCGVAHLRCNVAAGNRTRKLRPTTSEQW